MNTKNNIQKRHVATNDNSILHLYLISDSTAETISAVAYNTISQLRDAQIEQHVFPLTRTKENIDEILEQVQRNPGVVMCTIFEEHLEQYLINRCKKLKTPLLASIIKDCKRAFRIF